jgi:hypothetical protein
VCVCVCVCGGRSVGVVSLDQHVIKTIGNAIHNASVELSGLPERHPMGNLPHTDTHNT